MFSLLKIVEIVVIVALQMNILFKAKGFIFDKNFDAAESVRYRLSSITDLFKKLLLSNDRRGE